MCNRKPRFVKKQERSGLVLGLNSPFRRIPLIDNILNEIINKFLLAGDKFIPEIHLRQPKFTNSDSPNLLIGLVELSLKTKYEYKNLKKQQIQNVYLKMN